MSLEGKWYNELGSEMILKVSGSELTGTYQTKVGDASGTYNLFGCTDNSPISTNRAVAWVVAWVNQESGSSHSVTSWSGQYQIIDEEEAITASWLLTKETEPNADWQSTLVGKDIFTRREPSEAEIAKLVKRGPYSHP